MEVNGKIKQARKKAKLTQKELGEKLGVSQVMIAQYENGTRKPKFETLQKIANATKIPVNYFIEKRLISVNSKKYKAP